ncbi:hypothetical protein BJ165DRAFT_774106 [Panaeolus papilionaceus]|nr:hypothetical protein BJ165DRAFT_774106 [Panaeolus papilionaceus]
MYWNIPLLFFAFISTTLANSELALFGALVGHTDSLLARQSPAGVCDTACADSTTVIKGCTNNAQLAGCLCTVPNAHLFQQCIDCGTMVSSPNATANARQIADTFNSLCVSSASTIKPLTVSGVPSGSGSGGVSVTAPTPSDDPIPTSTIGQVTIGPSTTALTPSVPNSSPGVTATSPPIIQGAATKTMLTPTFELWSVLMIAIIFFSS